MRYEDLPEEVKKKIEELEENEDVEVIKHKPVESYEFTESRKVSPDDLDKLPFTAKADFRDNYPFGLLAVPMQDVVRVHASSGTTGKPTVVAYTRNDLDVWADVTARTLAAGDVTEKDVVQNAYGYGLFTGGLGMHYGGELIGATVIPMSGGNTKRQIMLAQDLGSTAICCTPSYSLIIAETALEMGIDLKASRLRIGVLGAEPSSEKMRAEIEAKLPMRAIDIYGLTEIVGPGVSVECQHQCGMHIFEDHFLAEIIDPQTGEQLPYGKTGELVLTTLTKEALPVLRFRTRDITAINAEPCECGRTLVRMSKITGRTDDMLIIRGINVFPSQIESVLLEGEGVEPHYQIIVDREHHMDAIEIWVEVSEEVFSDEMPKMAALGQKVRNELESVLGISARVKLVEPKTLARTEGKAKRVIDRREL